MKVRKALFQHDEPWRFTQGRWVTGMTNNNGKIQFSFSATPLPRYYYCICLPYPLHMRNVMDYWISDNTVTWPYLIFKWFIALFLLAHQVLSLWFNFDTSRGNPERQKIQFWLYWLHLTLSFLNICSFAGLASIWFMLPIGALSSLLWLWF